MTSEEAKVLLGATRPGDERTATESGHAEVREAFARLDSDAPLRHWYEGECVVDEAVSGRVLAAVGVPPQGLRERLLEAVAIGGQEAGAGKPVGTPAWGGRGIKLRQWGAIAAAVAVLGVAGLGLRDGWFTPAEAPSANDVVAAEPLSFVSFRHAMADYANGKIQLAFRGEDREALKRWVAENAAPDFDVLPEKMIAFPGIGCAVIDWDGQKVSLFCFRNTANGNVGHLFVIARENVRGLPLGDTSGKPAVCCGLQTVAWEDGSRLYLLVGHEPDVPISDFF